MTAKAEAKSYALVEKYAGLIVDVSDPEYPLIKTDDVILTKRKFDLIALLDMKSRKICYEIGYGGMSPYKKNEGRLSFTIKERYHYQFTLNKNLRELLRFIFYMVAADKMHDKSESSYAKKESSFRSGIAHYRKNGDLYRIDKECLYKKGVRFIVSPEDTEIIDMFLEEEPFGRHWKWQMPWFVKTAGGWLAKGTKGKHSLATFFSYMSKNGRYPNQRFLQPNILKHVLEKMGLKHKLFLVFLEKHYPLRVKKFQNYMSAHQIAKHNFRSLNNSLSIAFRKRKENGCFVFEVFPSESFVPLPQWTEGLKD